jgi:Fur family iron response transcriptional regulator
MDALSANILTDELNEAQSCVTCEEICTGYPDGGCLDRLRTAGLRPTRQRLMLGELLFLKGDRHVTAEMLYAEAVQANIQLSLATVYNTLNQFTQAGLLRRIGPDGSKSFFDTNTSVHPHFYLEGEDILVDIPDTLALEHMPEALPGHEISRLDIIIHIRRKPRDADI